METAIDNMHLPKMYILICLSQNRQSSMLQIQNSTFQKWESHKVCIPDFQDQNHRAIIMIITATTP